VALEMAAGRVSAGVKHYRGGGLTWGAYCAVSSGDVAPERAADGFYSGEWGWGYG